MLEILPKGAKVLWISSTGGHLAELLRIERIIEANNDSLWVTFDTPQSTTLMANRRHAFVDYVAPRDLAATFNASKSILKILKDEKFDLCLSTGAAVACAGLPLSALAGIPTYYVESVARTIGPSLTGRLLRLAPRVKTLTQNAAWSSRRWPYPGTVLDTFEVGKRPVPADVRKILVTLGTIRPYRFGRAVDAILSILTPEDQVVWQLGSSYREGLPGESYREISEEELKRHALEADVVISHAGVGSILQFLELGKVPVLVVRSGHHNEHVDEHQKEIADETARRGLACILDLDSPQRQVLLDAALRHAALKDMHSGTTVLRKSA